MNTQIVIATGALLVLLVVAAFGIYKEVNKIAGMRKLAEDDRSPMSSPHGPSSETEVDLGVWSGLKFGFGFGMGMFLAGIVLSIFFGAIFIQAFKGVVSVL